MADVHADADVDATTNSQQSNEDEQDDATEGIFCDINTVRDAIVTSGLVTKYNVLRDICNYIAAYINEPFKTKLREEMIIHRSKGDYHHYREFPLVHALTYDADGSREVWTTENNGGSLVDLIVDLTQLGQNINSTKNKENKENKENTNDSNENKTNNQEKQSKKEKEKEKEKETDDDRNTSNNSPFYRVTKFHLKAPSGGYSNPVTCGIVWLFKNKPIMENLKKNCDYGVSKNELIKCIDLKQLSKELKLSNQRDCDIKNGSLKNENLPIVCNIIENYRENKVSTAEINEKIVSSNDVAGRYIVVKMFILKRDGLDLDIEYFGFDVQQVLSN